MDCRTGEIHEMTPDEIAAWELENARPLLPLKHELVTGTKKLSPSKRKKFFKHQPCPCGSGKKFLKCCWNSYA